MTNLLNTLLKYISRIGTHHADCKTTYIVLPHNERWEIEYKRKVDTGLTVRIFGQFFGHFVLVIK